jgi:uncharacterized RDD family membrane protein YckC
MSCPICGELCRCAEPRTYVSRSLNLAEIDAYDPSEEQFASSLAGRDSVQDQELASGSLASARQRYAAQLPDVEAEVSQPDLHLTTPLIPDESWREEVASRIQNYKARRRHSLGDESLSFNFESTAGNHVFLRPEIEPQAEPVPYEQPDPLTAYYAHPYATAREMEPHYTPTDHSMDHNIPETPEVTSLPDPPPPPAPETAKLILFPKPPMMQAAPVDQLAEPVFDVPRIMEAPDATEAVTVPLADITLQPDPGEDTCVPYIEPLLELPVPVAPVPQRVFAEVADTLLVLLATGMFGTIVFHLGAASIFGDQRSLAGLVVLVPAIFWSLYKYLFLVHGGATLGMKVAHLRLVDFDGSAPPAAPRRYRALAMLISAFPLGLGLLWSFVDTETLCWHDRISKTYVTAR